MAVTRASGRRLGADDRVVLAAHDGARPCSSRLPLGWPEPFVDFVVAHRNGHVPMPTGFDGLAWRRTLSRRATDLASDGAVGVWPLIVAADPDHGGSDAWRTTQSTAGARPWTGRRRTVIETHSAAALKQRGLLHQGYERACGTRAPSAGSTRWAAAPALGLGDAAAMPPLRLRRPGPDRRTFAGPAATGYGRGWDRPAGRPSQPRVPVTVRRTRVRGGRRRAKAEPPAASD
jgi:hypothetical protein